MSRKTIAIDLDDVLAEHVEAFIEFSNKNYDTNLTIDQYSDHWIDLWGEIDREEIERRAAEFHTHESTIGYKVKKDAKRVLTKLSRDNDLYIVTARPKHLVDASIDWVNTHFAGVFEDVHFVPIWEPDNTVTKADICRQIGATYLVDDLVRHCNIAAEGGITAILFGAYPWNRHQVVNPDVIICREWDDVQIAINNLI